MILKDIQEVKNDKLKNLNPEKEQSKKKICNGRCV
jgi:hypothetical protein